MCSNFATFMPANLPTSPDPDLQLPSDASALLPIPRAFPSPRVSYMPHKNPWHTRLALPACLTAIAPACRSICLPVCLSVCVSACLPVCLSVYLPACLSVYLSICLFLWLAGWPEVNAGNSRVARSCRSPFPRSGMPPKPRPAPALSATEAPGNKGIMTEAQGRHFYQIFQMFAAVRTIACYLLRDVNFCNVAWWLVRLCCLELCDLGLFAPAHLSLCSCHI